MIGLFRKPAGRFYYVDSGLHGELGHHTNSCRHITRELRRRGLETTVLAFKGVAPALQRELKALPFFRSFTDWNTDGDPISGWLNHFDVAAQETEEDLSRLNGLTANDIVYMNSAQAAQLLAVVRWMDGLSPKSMPHVVLEFGVDPGLQVEQRLEGLAFRAMDPRIDPRAVLYRFTAKYLSRIDPGRLHLTTFEPSSSLAYSFLLQRPVGVLPIPRQLGGHFHDRRGRRPITVSVLGDQRPEKGYHLIPEVARRLLRANDAIRLLVHNADPSKMKDSHSQLRALAADNPRLELDEYIADEDLWAALLDKTDVVLCPYDRNRYTISYSAVAAEAIANGIPLVVPEGTSMAQMVRDFGGAGTVFDEPTVEAIVNAVLKAVDQFDTLAELAIRGSQQWQVQQGPKAFVDAVLDLTGNPISAPSITGTALI